MLQVLNILFLGYVIIWPLFSASVFQIDGAGRMYMLLSTLVLLLNFPNQKFRSVLKSPICWTWILWIIYSVANKLRAGIPPENDIPMLSFIFVYLILPFISLWVAAYEMQSRPKQLLQSLLVIFVIYLMWGLLVVKSGPASIDREGQILGNEFALASLSIITVSCFCYNLSLIKGRTLFLILALSTIAIFALATRKALAGELIILCIFYISRNFKLTFANFLKIGLMLFLLYLATSYVMENTVIGERFSTIEEDADKFNTTDSDVLSLLGDRAYFYIKGWEIFLQHPVIGIGIDNFRAVADYPMPIHSEYMVQLVENGVVGFVLYLAFILSILSAVRKIKDVSLRGLSFGWIICVLFISFTSWTYDMPLFYIVFGLILGLQKQNNASPRL